MKVLLDTHAILWFFSDDEKLSVAARKNITNVSNDIYVSIASAWEIAIKISLGKLKVEGGIEKYFSAVRDSGFFTFPIKKEYIEYLETLPYHHRDPFDRMLISTAIKEGISIVSTDKSFDDYQLPRIW